MSIERVRAYFRERNMEDRVQEFEVSSATVELAAQALNVKGQRIAKTLSFHVDDHVVLIVAAGDAKIANPKYKGSVPHQGKNAFPRGGRDPHRPRPSAASAPSL